MAQWIHQLIGCTLFIYLFLKSSFWNEGIVICIRISYNMKFVIFSLPFDSIRIGSENVNVIPTQMSKEFGINIKHYENAKDK